MADGVPESLVIQESLAAVDAMDLYSTSMNLQIMVFSFFEVHLIREVP